jgi:hypothetical protein
MFSPLLDFSSEEIDSLEQEVFAHPAWHGSLLGVESEDLLRGKPAFSYILRPGEARFHYYLSFVVEAPFIYKHQPFMVAFQDLVGGWGHRNGYLHWASKLEDLIPLIIHQPKDSCLPIVNASKRCPL